MARNGFRTAAVAAALIIFAAGFGVGAAHSWPFLRTRTTTMTESQLWGNDTYPCGFNSAYTAGNTIQHNASLALYLAWEDHGHSGTGTQVNFRIAPLPADNYPVQADFTDVKTVSYGSFATFFNFPLDTTSGKYVIQWQWVEFYSCIDVEVSGSVVLGPTIPVNNTFDPTIGSSFRDAVEGYSLFWVAFFTGLGICCLCCGGGFIMTYILNCKVCRWCCGKKKGNNKYMAADESYGDRDVSEMSDVELRDEVLRLRSEVQSLESSHHDGSSFREMASPSAPPMSAGGGGGFDSPAPVSWTPNATSAAPRSAAPRSAAPPPPRGAAPAPPSDKPPPPPF